jgi:hypothetical protein
LSYFPQQGQERPPFFIIFTGSFLATQRLSSTIKKAIQGNSCKPFVLNNPSTAYFNTKPKYPFPIPPLSLYIHASELYTALQEGQTFPQALLASAVATFQHHPLFKEEANLKSKFSAAISGLLHNSQLVLLLDDLESIPPSSLSKFISDLVTAQKDLAVRPSLEDRLFLHRVIGVVRSVSMSKQPTDSRVHYLLLSSRLRKEEEKLLFLSSLLDKRPLSKKAPPMVEAGEATPKSEVRKNLSFRSSQTIWRNSNGQKKAFS